MSILGSRLSDAGLRVVNVGYPSKAEPLEALVDRLAAELEACCADRLRDVHFVTHSMGGVLVHMYLSEADRPHRGRVVMLAPPSQGSEIVDAFSDSPLLRRWLGPAGVQLGTDTTSVPNRLGAPRFELGIIAGDATLNPISSWIIPGPDDGKVSVERARAEGAADFLVLPATHTFIMNRADVAEQTAHFLRTGRFHREGVESAPAPDTVGIA
jgi:hypothetical protein